MSRFIYILIILAVLTGAGVYFLYPPQVLTWAIDSQITIKFDKPVKRQEISHAITPEVLGEWSLKDSLTKNHLFRTLVFTPAIGFKPDTEYRINLENIVNTFGIGKAGNFSFIFKAGCARPGLAQSCARPGRAQPEPKVTLMDIPMDWQDYPLSCEAASLKMALAAKDISISED